MAFLITFISLYLSTQLSQNKMSYQKKDYLDVTVAYIEAGGLSSTSPISRKIISVGLFLPMTLMLVYLIFRKFWDPTGVLDILVLAEMFESLTTCAHLILRKYVVFVHGKLIKLAVKERAEQFWDYNLFGKEFGQTLQRKMLICLRIARTIIAGGFITIGLFCLTTVVDKSKIVPLICWTPENRILVGIIYISEVLIMLEIMHVLLGLDCFYLLVCTDLRNQFILLQRMIKTINFESGHEEKSYKKFVRCTLHHKFLLRFHNTINTIFSEYFIVLYLITAVSASMHGYIVLFRAPSPGDFIKSLCYLSGMLFQVGLFFIITSNVEIEAENLSKEIYNINWEVTGDTKIRKHMLLMLMKSQIPVTITGGGMLHVNRNEYVGLCRLAYSIATILGGMT